MRPALICGIVFSLSACGGDAETLVESMECASGLEWAGGDDGNELMHPGRDCIGCHDDRGGPLLAFGGTVYGEAGEDDECAGLDGVIVTITDANQDDYVVTTNEAGNFYLRRSEAPNLTFPIFASIDKDGTVNRMFTPIEEGSCNTCHGKSGSGGASGRIISIPLTP
jgi:hypothetical protein